eukprot:scaffold195679_cov29-Tisochrysis_lutea.AAC.2
MAQASTAHDAQAKPCAPPPYLLTPEARAQMSHLLLRRRPSRRRPSACPPSMSSPWRPTPRRFA